VFSVWSVRRLPKEDQLPLRESLETTAVRMLVLGVRTPPACQDVSPGAEEHPLLEAAVKQRLVKTEKAFCVL
jgi:hypothetical protein